MKKVLYAFAALLALAFTACNKNQNEPQSQDNVQTVLLRFSANADELRMVANYDESAKKVSYTWEVGETVYGYVFNKYNHNFYKSTATVESVSEDGKTASFDLPATGFDAGHMNELYDVYLSTTPLVVSGNELNLKAPGCLMPIESLKNFGFIAALAVNPSTLGSSPLSAQFQNKGALYLLKVEALADGTTDNVNILVKEGSTQPTYLPVSNVSGGETTYTNGGIWSANVNTPSSLTKGVHQMAAWFIPQATAIDVIKVEATVDGVSSSVQRTLGTSKTFTAAGVYNLPTTLQIRADKRVQWEDQPLVEGDNTVKFSTGQSLIYQVEAAEADKAGVWLDKNANGTKDTGEEVTTFGTQITESMLTTDAPVLHGNITKLTVWAPDATPGFSGLDATGHATLQEVTVTTQNTWATPAKNVVLTNCTALAKADLTLTASPTVNLSGATALTDLTFRKNYVQGAIDAVKTQLVNLTITGTTTLTNYNVSGYTALQRLDLSMNSNFGATSGWGSFPPAITFGNDNGALVWINVAGGKLTKSLMPTWSMLQSMFDRSALTPRGTLVFTTGSDGQSGSTSDITAANNKGWDVVDTNGNAYTGA